LLVTVPVLLVQVVVSGRKGGLHLDITFESVSSVGEIGWKLGHLDFGIWLNAKLFTLYFDPCLFHLITKNSMKRKYTDGNTTPSLTNDNDDDDSGVHDAAATAEKALSIIPKRDKNHTTPVIILPQGPQKTLGSTRANKIQQTYRIQCWAHTKSGIRCSSMVSSREGEPVPIPYCDVHLKSGDGALKVVRHPIAGKCLVARSVLLFLCNCIIISSYIILMFYQMTHSSTVYEFIHDASPRHDRSKI
jgi:hypothetical protein